MKKLKIKSILFIAFMLSQFSLYTAGKNPNDTTVVYQVSMDCQKCKQKIEKNIAFEKGVKALSVDLDAKTVKVTYTKAKNDVAKLQKAIEKLGYEVAVKNEASN